MIFENSSWHKSTIIRSVQKRTSIGCLLENLQPREGGYKTASERLNDRVPSNQAGSKPSRARDCKPSIFSRSLLPYTSGMLRKSKQKLRSDALAMMGEGGMFQGFVISKLNNLRLMKPDLEGTDENWEGWKWRISWTAYKNGWRGTGRKNNMEEYEKTRGRGDTENKRWHNATR